MLSDSLPGGHQTEYTPPLNGPKSSKGADIDVAFERIQRAIVSHKLLPGTRLKEEELCEALSISRGTVRLLLRQLSHHHLITLVPHSGAFVAQPSREEAREIFKTRRLIELDLTRELAMNCTPQDRLVLERHAARETEAHQSGDINTRIRLSGEFHLLIGALAKRPVLYQFLQQIIARSSLIVALYQRPYSLSGRNAGDRACMEHQELIEAIAARRVAEATSLMEKHLEELENQLDLDASQKQKLDLKSVFT